MGTGEGHLDTDSIEPGSRESLGHGRPGGQQEIGSGDGGGGGGAAEEMDRHGSDVGGLSGRTYPERSAVLSYLWVLFYEI